jgi:DNA-binding GntR family transcriptional regulator
MSTNKHSSATVAYTTVRRAMEVLRERDVIITWYGRGTFVKPQR